MKNTGSMRLVFGDVTLGVHGEDFSYIFSYQQGGLESFVRYGTEWLYRAPKPTYWRATTDNDRGNGFSFRSAMWMGADLYHSCCGISVKRNNQSISLPIAPENNRYGELENAESLQITFVYQTATQPATETEVSYCVWADGKMQIQITYHGKKGLPELPVLGLRWVMPFMAQSYCYQGLSGETYPDRMQGGIPGEYRVEGVPVTPYLVPQECGMHMQTKWVSISKADTPQQSLRFLQKEGELAFSCLPYTALELESASHQEELPLPRRTVLCLCGAVRGVGGIDSWGSDVSAPYHISAEKDIQYSFIIS